MRSIHTTNQKDYNKNTPYRVIHKHRTKLGNPIWGIIALSLIIPLLSLLLLSSTYTYAESSVSLSVDNSATVLELTVPSSVSLNLTPSSANNYNPSGTASLSVSAGTNNITGYTLTMSVPNTNLTNSGITLTSINNPNHIPLDNSNHPIIPTITSTYTDDSDFPDNTWGYRIGNTTYSPVSSNISLPGTNSAGNATTTTIELAAKVNSAQPAGTYSTALNFVAVANPAIYTITWNANGGTITSVAPSVSTVTTTHQEGTKLGTLPTAAKDGSNLAGWFTAIDGGEEITTDTVVMNDGTYYARWEEQKLPSVTLKAGYFISAPSTPLTTTMTVVSNGVSQTYIFSGGSDNQLPEGMIKEGDYYDGWLREDYIFENVSAFSVDAVCFTNSSLHGDVIIDGANIATPYTNNALSNNIEINGVYIKPGRSGCMF